MAIILRSGIVKLLDVRSGKLLHQLDSGVSDAFVSLRTYSPYRQCLDLLAKQHLANTNDFQLMSPAFVRWSCSDLPAQKSLF